MVWKIEFDSAFEAEFATFPREVQDALLATARLLADYGPKLGRPHADTLKGSKFANMKELRFEGAGGEWRAAFAFDPARNGIVLVAGDKSGGSEKLFYKQLIAKADRRYAAHLEQLNTARKGK